MHTPRARSGDDDPLDDYDKPRISDWDSLAEARAAADASPARHRGSVLIKWERRFAAGPAKVRYSWRDSGKGMDFPPAAEVLERFTNGRWEKLDHAPR